MNRTFLASLSIFSFSFLLFALYSLPSLTHAQAIPTGIGGLELTTSSDNPAPGQTVTITVRSYNTDINSAKITWAVNGKTSQSGDGLTTFQVQAPSFGKKLTIKVSAVTSVGTVLTNTIVIGSGSVDMIIEADGYVPLFFKGKLPISYQNSFKVIAFPHIANSAGVEYDPKTLVYQWKKNGQAIEDQSGYGKMSIKLTGDIVPRAYSITVDVSTRDNSAQTSGLMTADFQSPTIGFYVNDPLYGALFNSAINGRVYIGSQKETGVLAVPFGFNVGSTGNSGLSLDWLINGVEHPELASNQSIVLRAPDGIAGTSNIELDIQHASNILQSSKAAFTAVFSANAASARTVSPGN